MRGNLPTLPDRLLNWLYPPVCVLCLGSAHRPASLCRSCLNDLARNTGACPVCASPLPAIGPEPLTCGQCLTHPPFFDKVHAPYLYQTPADKLIISLKFKGMFAIAELLAGLMLGKLCDAPTPECLIPVPLHKRRLRERGYNQAIELARPLAKFFDIPIINAAARIRHTPAQSLLSLAERERNVRGAFDIHSDLLGDKNHVAIIDDVVTTGSTVNELARLLRVAGMEKIQIWSFARTSAPKLTSQDNVQ